jgi:hypothetical protein
MIDFFHHGSIIGFSINGWSGFLLLIYLLIEIFFLIITKVSLTHKIFLGLRVRNQIKKMLPDWWYIEKISYITINRRQGEYQVYVKVRSKISTGSYHIYESNTCNTNDWVEVNWLGTIKKQSLMASIFVEDKLHENEIKQWSREKALEKIGI